MLFLFPQSLPHLLFPNFAMLFRDADQHHTLVLLASRKGFLWSAIPTFTASIYPLWTLWSLISFCHSWLVCNSSIIFEEGSQKIKVFFEDHLTAFGWIIKLVEAEGKLIDAMGELLLELEDGLACGIVVDELDTDFHFLVDFISELLLHWLKLDCLPLGFFMTMRKIQNAWLYLINTPYILSKPLQKAVWLSQPCLHLNRYWTLALPPLHYPVLFLFLVLVVSCFGIPLKQFDHINKTFNFDVDAVYSIFEFAYDWSDCTRITVWRGNIFWDW